MTAAGAAPGLTFTFPSAVHLPAGLLQGFHHPLLSVNALYGLISASTVYFNPHPEYSTAQNTPADRLLFKIQLTRYYTSFPADVKHFLA